MSANFALMLDALEERIVDTPCGKIRGRVEDGIRVFRGIVYARYQRFQLPTLSTSWESVYDASTYGTVCPQHSPRLASLIGEEFGSHPQEGNLCLTLYSPENAANLPVMVWIHGGSYLTGGSEEKRYSGERLVKTGNLLVVKISYRLGVLGYLWREGFPVNLGLEDQRMALQWIQCNISAFGGDPSNVTVFGQSAGAHGIASLIATTRERPLFSKAILQSPPIGVRITPRKASKITRTFLKKLGKMPEDATVEEILNVQDQLKGRNMGLAFMPVLPDNTRIPQSVSESGMKIVLGYTAQDAAPFFQKLLGSFIGDWIIKYFTKRIFSTAIEKYARELRKTGLQADVYHIRWYPDGSKLKSCHSIELPFILGVWEDWKDAKMLCGLSREEYERISSVFLKAWTDFATKGVFTELF